VLRDLHVENLAVISEASIRFEPGLNALTGETGAGKSLVVDALALLSGARASGDLIRTGAPGLSVIGVFEPAGDSWRAALEEAGLEAEGSELVIRREVNREGRNRVYLNDRPVSLGLVSEVGKSLIRIHTQREELDLVSPAMQRQWLDESAGEPGRKLRDKVATLFEIFDHLRQRLERARARSRSRSERADLLRFQIGEIDEAAMQANEDVDLERERNLLRHAEAIHQALGTSYAQLFEDEGSAVEQVSASLRRIEGVEAWEKRSAEWVERLTRARVELEDVAVEIRSRVDEVTADPQRLDRVEERLSQLDRLGRKYGGSVAKILEYRDAIGLELEELETEFEHRNTLIERVELAFEEYRQAASELSEARCMWADDLTQRVEDELADLALEDAKFEVQLDTVPQRGSRLTVDGTACAYSGTGFDRVEFQLAANPGETMAPLSRSASGGELSRIYLAVQLACRAGGPAANPTLVFDEVDAGIGGAEAAALGDKLAKLAAGGQILVVSHLPQVASSGDVHFRVSKIEDGGRTLTDVKRLSDREKVQEIARMLGGRELTSITISHAEEMIDIKGGREL